MHALKAHRYVKLSIRNMQARQCRSKAACSGVMPCIPPIPTLQEDAKQYLHRAGRAGRVGSTSGVRVWTMCVGVWVCMWSYMPHSAHGCVLHTRAYLCNWLSKHRRMLPLLLRSKPFVWFNPSHYVSTCISNRGHHHDSGHASRVGVHQGSGAGTKHHNARGEAARHWHPFRFSTGLERDCECIADAL